MLPLVLLLTLPTLAPPLGQAQDKDLAAGRAISVAVLPVVARDERNGPLAELLADQVVAELRNRAVFGRIVTPAEISLLIGNEHKQQLLACANDHCALVDQELSGALGVTHLVVGNVAAVNKTVIFNLKLVDLRRLEEVSSIIRQADAGNEEALFAVVPAMVPDMLLQAGLVAPPALVARQGGSAAKDVGKAPAGRPWLVGGGAVAAAGAVAGVFAAGLLGGGAAMLTALVAPAVRRDTGLPLPTLVPGGPLWNPFRMASWTVMGGGAAGVVLAAGVGVGGLALMALGAALGAP